MRQHKERETVVWFLKEATDTEAGAIVAYYYLLTRYVAWRRLYGLLQSELSETEFAAAVEVCGVKADAQRKLFFDVRARDFSAESSAEMFTAPESFAP
jgi:hypothetical protein